MAKFCKEDNIVMTLYSLLSGGRLSKLPEESSKRKKE